MLHERRIHREDRRRFTRCTAKPDAGGTGRYLRDRDTRRIPDRRLSNILAEWIDDVVLGS